MTLYDENFEKRDRFSTKPAEKGPKNYIVRGLCFSPDSSRLAVAQSDCIVFVYKLGLEWGEVSTKGLYCVCACLYKAASRAAVCWSKKLLFCCGVLSL